MPRDSYGREASVGGRFSAGSKSTRVEEAPKGVGQTDNF